MQPKLSVIVAARHPDGAIGVNGSIPWRIKTDMEFFRLTTIRDKNNAVIMGLRTWESIPPRFRPFADRLNIIVSTTLLVAPEGAHVVKSLDQALDLVAKRSVNIAYVIGGARLYREAIDHEACKEVLLTRILGGSDVKCDTFIDFAWLKNNDFCLTEQSDRATEGPFEFQFETWLRA